MKNILDITLTAVPENLSTARKYVRTYLNEMGWPPEQLQDIISSVGDVIRTFVIEDEEPGSFHIMVEISDGENLVVFVNGNKNKLESNGAVLQFPYTIHSKNILHKVG